MAAYTYTKINWENEPSYNTPINEANLNHMDQAIFDLAYVKAEKEDAVFVNSISLERKAGTTVGHYSVAAGYDTEASGISSVAIGTNTSAKNGQAFAGGDNSKALGNTSFAFGTNCITRFNSFESLALGNHCIAGSANQMVFGQYNVEDTAGTYAEIVGNGSSGNESNARTLDWQGNETIAGDFTNGNGETLHGIYEALPVDTESGNPAVITDAFGGACKSLKLTLEPIQSGSGTPSPQNARPISGRTQSVVTRTGKNLYVGSPSFEGYGSLSDWTKDTQTYNGHDVYKKNTAWNGLYKLVDLPIGTYTFSCAIKADSAVNVTIYINGKGSTATMSPANKNVSVSTSWSVVSVTFAVTVAGTVACRIEKSADSANYVYISEYQIEVGSTTMDYAPYETPSSITRTYGTTIYGGSDDVTGEGATVTKALYVPSVSSVGYSSSAGCNYADCHGITIVEDSETICNMYDQIPYGNTGAEGKYKIDPSAVTIYDNRFTDVATAQSILNSCQIVYPLFTPTFIPLSAQNITLLHGDNVLTTDADNIEASYSADIALYIEKKIAEGISQGNRSLSKGGVSEEDPKDEEKKEEVEIKEEEPLTKEVR